MKSAWIIATIQHAARTTGAPFHTRVRPCPPCVEGLEPAALPARKMLNRPMEFTHGDFRDNELLREDSIYPQFTAHLSSSEVRKSREGLRIRAALVAENVGTTAGVQAALHA